MPGINDGFQGYPEEWMGLLMVYGEYLRHGWDH